MGPLLLRDDPDSIRVALPIVSLLVQEEPGPRQVIQEPVPVPDVPFRPADDVFVLQPLVLDGRLAASEQPLVVILEPEPLGALEDARPGLRAVEPAPPPVEQQDGEVLLAQG